MQFRSTLGSLAFVLVAGLVGGCAAPLARYSFKIDKVIEPPNAVEEFSMVEIGTEAVTCQNRLFSIAWTFEWSSVDLVLQNLTDEPLRVDWDECVLVDPSGACHHIVPSEIRYIDNYASVKAAKVLGHCSAVARIIPRDNIRYGLYGWTEVPYLPKQTFGDRGKFRELVHSYKGKTIKVLLAVEYGGIPYEYQFDFEIVDTALRASSVKVGSGDEMF